MALFPLAHLVSSIYRYLMTPANWPGSPSIAMVISSWKLKLAQDSGTKCGGSRAQLSAPAHTGC